MEDPAPAFYNPWLTEWDNNLCDVCNRTDFRTMFGVQTWDDADYPGAFSEGGAESPRTFAYIRDHQSCAFCRLVYHGLKDADNWYFVEERAVWLSAGVFAWFLTQGKTHQYRHRIEKKIFLRVQRDCLGLDEHWDENKTREVLTEQVAQIQVLAQHPDCLTGPAWYETLSRYMARGSSDIFDVSDYESPEDRTQVENANASACRGRWIPKDKVDFDMIKNWLWVCDSFHDEQCRPQTQQDHGSPGYPRRVIDVRRGSVVSAPARCRYVCLSYVWGGVKQLVLNDQTIDQLSSDGGIFEAHTEADGRETRISRTVEEAVLATQRLGEQYLWVDAFCIKQDDATSTKMEEINAMDVIYSQASLTIVAAAGHSADAGLPGVRTGSRNVLQHMEVVKNRCLIMTTSPTHELDVSIWERRGWTLQERALSRRLLVFTANQVYLSCRETNFSEDTVSELATRDIKIIDFPSRTHTWDSVYVADNGRHGLAYYHNLVRQFTIRQISYPEDALNACQGLLSDYRKRSRVGDPRSTFGLPLSDLTAALCWTARPHNPARRRKGFPSWSWAGWSTIALYRDEDSTVGVQIRSNLLAAPPTETDESQEAYICRESCPRALQDFDPASPILRFEALMFKLRVSRTKESWPYGERAYKLTSPDDAEHCFGAVRLDEAWRDSRPDLLDFIIVGLSCHKSGDESSYGVKLMCIEWVDDIAYRVQLAHDPKMDERGFYTPPGKGRQSLDSLIRLKPRPDKFTLITLH